MRPKSSVSLIIKEIQVRVSLFTYWTKITKLANMVLAKAGGASTSQFI